MNTVQKRLSVVGFTVLLILFACVSLYGATGTRHVFYLDSNSHVHQLYSTASGWSDLDLTDLTGAPVAASGSGLTSILDSATNYVHLYYQISTCGTCGQGDVYELYGTGTTWYADNPTALAGTGNVPGPNDGLTSIIGSGSAIHVFYNSTNVDELNWLGGTDWTADSPSYQAGDTGGAPCYSDPSALTSFMDRSNGNNIRHVFCMGTFEDVYEFYYTTAWHTDVPTTLAGAPSGSVYSNITSFIDNTGGTASVMHVFYLGTNLNVYELYYTSSWHYDDPTSVAGAPVAGTVSGKLSPLTSFINTSGSGDTGMHVMYLGTNDHLYALHWVSGTNWSYFDATASSGAPSAAPDSALTSFQDLAGGVRLYFLGTNSHVYELYWPREGAATQTDLIAASGGTIAVSGSALTGVVGP